MPGEPIQPVQRGQISAGALRRAADLAYAQDRAVPSGRYGGFSGGDGPQTYDNSPKKKLIKLTSNSGNAYAWTEQYDDGSGNPVDQPASFQGTTTIIPAYEITGLTTVPANTVVWAEPAADGMSLLFRFASGGGGGSGFTGTKPRVTAVSCAGGAFTDTVITDTYINGALQ
jgi:hypothetical protein